MHTAHPDISGVDVRFKSGLDKALIQALLQHFMGELHLFVSFQSQVWD